MSDFPLYDEPPRSTFMQRLARVVRPLAAPLTGLAIGSATAYSVYDGVGEGADAIAVREKDESDTYVRLRDKPFIEYEIEDVVDLGTAMIQKGAETTAVIIQDGAETIVAVTPAAVSGIATGGAAAVMYLAGFGASRRRPEPGDTETVRDAGSTPPSWAPLGGVDEWSRRYGVFSDGFAHSPPQAFDDRHIPTPDDVSAQLQDRLRLDGPNSGVQPLDSADFEAWAAELQKPNEGPAGHSLFD